MSERCYVVGPYFASGQPVRLRGIRGVGKIVGASFRTIVIEYTGYKVRIGVREYDAAPGDIIAEPYRDSAAEQGEAK